MMKQKSPVVPSELSYVNKSTFVIRLMHTSDPVTYLVETMDNIISPDDPPVLSVEEIVKSQGSIKTSKSNGPGKLAGKLLKPCKTSLLYILSTKFSNSPTVLSPFLPHGK